MSLAYFEVEKGFSIENQTHLLLVTVPPGGTTDTDNAPISSMAFDYVSGLHYRKHTAGTGADKWVQIVDKDYVDAAITGLSWREPVLVKEDTNYANLAAAEAQVNTTTVDGIAVADGTRILFTDITGENANVFIVTGTPGAGATLVEDTNTLTDNDTLWVSDGTSADTSWTYNGTSWVQFGAGDQTELGFIRAFIGKAAGNDLPAYTSTVYVANGDDLETAIGKLDAALDALAQNGNTPTVTNGVTAQTTVDSVLVDSVAAVKWLVVVKGSNLADAPNTMAAEIYATHDGHIVAPGADATDCDYTVYAKLRQGGNLPGLSFSVDLAGTGAAQTLELRVASTLSVDVRAVKTTVAF